MGTTIEPIETLELSGSVRNWLRRVGIDTVADLTTYSRAELHNKCRADGSRAIGKQRLDQIEQALAERGLTLAVEHS